MKFKITMKDPDTLHDAIEEAVIDDLKTIAGLSDDDRDALREGRQEAISKLARKWFEYGEYVTIEIDTVAETAVVCPLDR